MRPVLTKKFHLLLGRFAIFLSLFALAFQAGAQEGEKQLPVEISYGNKGLQFQTSDNRFLLQIQNRFQFRYATPSDQTPVDLTAYTEDNQQVFKIRRSRFKVGGHAYQPWLKYYFEYDWGSSSLLDYRLMLEKWEFLNFIIGQWKIYYNRERVISSGKQQLVDRSLINRAFTIDRQMGISVYGRLLKKTWADFTYHLTVATGNGRGNTSNDDEHLMYVGRIQWNLFGRELPMTSSDLEYHEQFTGSIAGAMSTNNSAYTRFSTSGGGQLENFTSDTVGQYRTHQFLIETAFMYKGFSWLQEYHLKEIRDHYHAQTTRMEGYFAQAGYFFHHAFSWFPKKLEIAGRYAAYRPDISHYSNAIEAYSIAANWFFKGHRNKLTADFTCFNSFEENGLFDGNRFRIQWDVSF